MDIDAIYDELIKDGMFKAATKLKELGQNRKRTVDVRIDVIGKIENIKRCALQEISKSALTGDTKSVIEKTKIVEQCEDLILKASELVRNVSELENISNKISTGSQNINYTDKEMSNKIDRSLSRDRGMYLREQFALNLKSHCIKATISNKAITKYYICNKYDVSIGEGTMGIAFASQIKNRWFLGLNDTKYDVIVLICDDNPNGIHHFILPLVLIDEIQPYLSSKDKLKFNVKRTDSGFFLSIPTLGSRDISCFDNNFAAFQAGNV